MLARQLHHHPAWTAAGLAAELAAARDRLELMRAENLSVAAAFDLSYQDLTAGQQRLFRRLGLHPGPDIDAYAAAALDGTDLATARRHLDGLYDQYLLTEPARGRYGLHDLLREHARALAAAGDPADAGAAAGRLLDYYLHTAAAAGQHIASRSTTAGRPPPGDRRRRPAAVHASGRPRPGWRPNTPNLHAAAGYAAASGRPGMPSPSPPRSAASCSPGVTGTRPRAAPGALAAARQADDRAGQASRSTSWASCSETGDYPAAAASRPGAGAVLRPGDRPARPAPYNLGTCSDTGDYPAAAASHQQALELYRDLGHRAGQALALKQSRHRASVTGDYPAAAASCQQALGMSRDLGHRRGPGHGPHQSGPRAVGGPETTRPPPPATSRRWSCSATSATGPARPSRINNSGPCRRLTGDYPAAAASRQQALALFRDLGNRRGQADALNDLGVVQQLTGDYPAAAASHQQALDMFRDVGDRHGQAEALNSLGELLSRSSDSRQARDHHAQALAIARDISAPLEEARALEGIGHCHLQDGNPGDGTAHLQQALAIYQRIGAPDARRVQETLRQHGITTALPPAGGQSRQPGPPTAP